MKVLHVDSASGWRGGQSQVLLTAEGMAQRGHDVLVACRKGGVLEQRAHEAGLDARPIPFRGDLSPGAIFALRRTLRDFQPAVVQLHDPHAVTAGLFAGRGGARRIATRRVDFHLRRALSRRKYAACDRLIAVSRAIVAILEQDGLAGERIRLVYEGVRARAERPGGADALAALGIPAGAPLVGNVAALTDHKDHGTLLEAAVLLKARMPEARLLIVGDGELRSSLEARARELGVADRVVFAGFRDDLDALIPAFTVFCLSSHREGLGTSLLDAMSFGRPIVATAAGGIPEAVEDGVTGRVVAIRDARALAAALAELLGDPATAASMGAAGRRRFEELFTAERMVDATLRVYEEAL
jgi:glycosyltransferase involved in cell wall biosynthesis